MTGSYEEVRLVKFHTPALLSEREQAAARRRFCTLLVPPQKGGFGGNAYVRRVQSGDRAFELALKMPRPDAQPEQEQLNRETLEEEYRTLSVVSNLRGFPDVYGFGYTADGTPALLMEWVDGVSLLDARPALSDGAATCPGDIVAALGLSVLKIILSTQSLDTPFVHRDLSMRNIMLRHDRIPLEEQVSSGYFDICLIDMGSAKLVKPDFSFTVDVNAFRGATPAYAAPEMLERFKADPGARDNPAVDIYALGSILYELYCGHAPFEAELRRSGDHARLKRTVQPQPLAPATPHEQGLVNAIIACLAASQDARPSANELAARLEPFARTGAPRKRRPAADRGSATALVDATAPANVAAPTSTVAQTQPAPRPTPSTETVRSAESMRRARLAVKRQRSMALTMVIVAFVVIVVILALASAGML